MRRQVIAVFAVCGIGLTVPALSAYATGGGSGCSYIEQVKNLGPKAENTSEYNRDDFGYDSTKVRDTLKIQEDPDGDGQYLSLWDGKYYKFDQLDADHHVSLAEAWDSGAHDWSAEDLKAFANDTAHVETINLVESGLNRGVKSDNDPAEWLPDTNKALYLDWWVQVKTDWDLSADQAEIDVLLDNAKAVCDREKAPSFPPPPPKTKKPEPSPTPKKSEKPSPKPKPEKESKAPKPEKSEKPKKESKKPEKSKEPKPEKSDKHTPKKVKPDDGIQANDTGMLLTGFGLITAGVLGGLYAMFHKGRRLRGRHRR